MSREKWGRVRILIAAHEGSKGLVTCRNPLEQELLCTKNAANDESLVEVGHGSGQGTYQARGTKVLREHEAQTSEPRDRSIEGQMWKEGGAQCQKIAPSS